MDLLCSSSVASVPMRVWHRRPSEEFGISRSSSQEKTPGGWNPGDETWSRFVLLFHLLSVGSLWSFSLEKSELL